MSEYTQEQVDAIVAEKVADATKGLFDEDTLNAKVTAEVDRRVESGIQKGLETQRKKWEDEFSKKAKLSAEELAKQQLEEQMNVISARESELAIKANKLNASDALAQAGITKSHYEKFIDMLVTPDEESTSSNVQNFIDVFSSTKKDIETNLKAELSKVPAPNTTQGDEGITKEKFLKMGYAEKMEFREKEPELFKQYISER